MRYAAMLALTLAVATPAAAELMTETVFACSDVEVLKAVLALSGDEQTDFYRGKLTEGLCTRMVKAETVKVLDRKSTPGFVQIETAYGGEKYWIVQDAVGE